MKRHLPVLNSYQIISLTFVGLIILGTLLLMLPAANADGRGLGFLDALFTSTSASCVTGLIVVDTGKHFSLFGQLVIISLIQLGGLGLMTFATLFSVVLGRKIGFQERLRLQESLNQNDVEGVVHLCLRVVKYSLAIEFIFGTILAIRFYSIFGVKGVYFGYWHAISAFCNAGFDLMGDFASLTHFVGDWTVNIVITSLIILGSCGFAVLEDVFHKRSFRKLRLHSKVSLITSALLIVGGTLLLWMVESGNPQTIANMPLSEQLLASYFQGVSPRTAGFNTLPLDKMRDGSIFLIVILMFIGASPASTGGGIKTTTFAVMVMMVWAFLRNNDSVVIFNRRIDRGIVGRSFVIITMGVVWIALVTFLVACFEDGRFLKIFFEVVSAFATVGLSMGETPHIGSISKIVLIITMFIGRVGVLTFALALMSKRRTENIKYPQEKIMIG